jgi:hypothetical protein
VDSSGNAWLTGSTYTAGWAVGGFDTIHNGSEEAFVAKLNPDGTLAWSSYLGGTRHDRAAHIAVDASGDGWVMGDSDSVGWVFGGFNARHGDDKDAFIARIHADGTPAWISYLGGTSWEAGSGIAIDGLGNAWVGGTTDSDDWATRGFDTNQGGQTDVFISKITPSDVTPPAVHAASFQYETWPNAVSVRFTEDVSATIALSELVITPLSGEPPFTVPVDTYSFGTNTARFVLRTFLGDGRYRARLAAASISDRAGHPLGTDYTFDFFVLSGDANRDRKVDITDLGILASNWEHSPRTFSQADFSYDGIVDITDLGILATNWQTNVPAPAARSPFATLTLGRRDRAIDLLEASADAAIT